MADAVRLLESLLGATLLPAETAVAILQDVQLPGDSDQAALYARMISALVALADLTGDQVASVFGTVAERADAVLRADPLALAVSVGTAEEGVIVTARIMHPPHPDAPAEPPEWDAGRRTSSDPANDDAVRVATLLADSCPDVVVIEIVTETPSGRRLKVGELEPGYKRMIRASFPPREKVRRNVAYQAAIRRLTAASSWTELIREQTAIAVEIMELLRQATARLSPTGTKARRLDWLTRAQSVARRTSQLATRPVAAAVDLDLPHASADDAERRPDPTSDALHAIAQVLPELLDLDRPLAMASRLDDAANKAKKARIVSDPLLSGVGRPLPEELDSLLIELVDILRAAAADPGLPRRIGAKKASNARALVEGVRRDVVERERALLGRTLVDVPGISFARVSDDEPPGNTVDREAWVVLAPLQSWNHTVESLRALTSEQRSTLTSSIG